MKNATAIAQPNIALVKYWGKADVASNLPASGSLSVTLDSLATSMSVTLDPELHADSLIVNGEPAPAMLPRISACLDNVLGPGRDRVHVESRGNFPIAAGLASSASSFAALVVAATEAAGAEFDRQRLAQLAGQASGSAARSLYGGFVELRRVSRHVEVETVLPADQWPLQVLVAITSTGQKPMSSGRAMQLSAQTSPFYRAWIDGQEHDLDVARNALSSRDFAALAAVSEHNCLKMHSVMWTTKPAIVYWKPATMSCIETIRRLQHRDVPVFFTIDAGPQIKALCPEEFASEIRDALADTEGVVDVLQSSIGQGARTTDAL